MTNARDEFATAQKLYNPAPSPIVGRVEHVRDVSAGTRFRCVQGRPWKLVRSMGTGAFLVENDDGQTNYFAGCALVELETA